jgi:hypothetical protein
MTDSGTRRDPIPAPSRFGWVTWALVAAVLVPLVVEAVHLLVDAGDFHAISDNALNELVVRNMGRRIPLLGPFARNEWSHPGPIFYFAMWPAYHLFGRDSTAMLVGALLINGLALTTIVAIGRRWGGEALAIPFALAAALIVVRLPHGYLADPWNPSVTVLPFGAFLVLAWAAGCGDRWAFPVAALAGTFCMQSHVGYVSLVVPVLAWSAWRTWRRGRDTPGRARWTPLATGLLVLAVLWAPPLYQQLTGTPGNVGRIIAYFRNSPEPAHTLADGWRLVAAQFTVNADWITGARIVTTVEPPAIHANPVPVLLLAFAVAVGYAQRIRGALRELSWVLVIAMVFGIIGLARTLGPMYDYRLRWIWVLAALCVGFTIAVAYRTVTALHTRTVGTVVRVATGVALVGLVAVGTANAVVSDPNDGEVKRTEALARQMLAHLPPGRGVVILRAASYGGYIAFSGVMLRATDAGVPVQVEADTDQARLTFGPARIHGDEPVRAIVVIATGDQIEAVRALPGVRRLAFVSGALGGRQGRTRAAVRNDDAAAFLVPGPRAPT